MTHHIRKGETCAVHISAENTEVELVYWPDGVQVHVVHGGYAADDSDGHLLSQA